MPDPPLPPLSVGDFPAFFSALWSAKDGPFSWQCSLVEQLDRERRWPSLVDLPTGSGKTSLLEIAVFQQALDAECPPASRWMPRRVVLVVDRRVVVDQAHDRGKRIAERLTDAADDSLLGRVAARLRHLFAGRAGDPPLVTSVLRGGIVRDESWAQRPDVAALLSSTVDQVGSRLLFRGYGVSASMRPVHAGLLSNDCLFLLDEVHLARPFAQTLAAIGGYRERAARPCTTSAAGWQVVEMTATPTREVAGARFPSAPLNPSSHPVLRRRLTASKPARLDKVPLPSHAGKADRLFAEACRTAALALLDAPAVSAVGVIVNRVNTARIIAGQLREALAAPDLKQMADVLLLTGRMRPIDRDAALDEFRHRLETGRARDESGRPLVVVATQCIEAGADFDLDAIVTECASLDALRQRFGRVDRDGQRSAASQELQSVVLARSTLVADDAEDPVYGRALARTWHWLNQQPRPVDFGILALPLPSDEELSALVPPPRNAPVMLPAHLDAWVQTNPQPALDPEVSRWLHGIEQPNAEVQIVWRDDLRPNLLQETPAERASTMTEEERARERLKRDVAVARIAACPPVSTEALSVPISAARRWLLRQPAADVADVEGALPMGTDHDDPVGGVRGAVRWVEGDNAAVVLPKQIEPGDLLVVPSDYGGIDQRSWAPDATEKVTDVAAAAIRAQRNLVVLRLDPAVAAWQDDPSFPDTAAWQEASTRERRTTIDDWLRDRIAAGTGPRRDLEDVRAAPARVRTVRVLDGFTAAHAADTDQSTSNAFVIIAPARHTSRRSGFAESANPPLGIESDLDALSFGGQWHPLAAHLDGVQAWVKHFTSQAAITPEIAADIALAASLHDLGKADRRFQSWLHCGDEIARAGAVEPLAKSSSASYDRATREAQRLQSGYPRGARHELTSVAMIASDRATLDRAHDPELVLHLVATHHGHCRSFAPIVHDPEPVLVEYERDGMHWSTSSSHRLERIDSGVTERFWTLVERYGWFGLAWLETLLRLADHRRSAQEQYRPERGA